MNPIHATVIIIGGLLKINTIKKPVN